MKKMKLLLAVALLGGLGFSVAQAQNSASDPNSEEYMVIEEDYTIEPMNQPASPSDQTPNTATPSQTDSKPSGTHSQTMPEKKTH